MFRIVYAENSGAFLGMGSGLPEVWRTALFSVGSGALLAVFTWLLIKGDWGFQRKLGLVLLLAGGASNWVDRLWRGSVVDFLNVGVGGLRTGIFNIADMAILAGLAVWAWPQRDEENRGEGDSDKASPSLPASS
jgi:signal peptidase II